MAESSGNDSRKRVTQGRLIALIMIAAIRFQSFMCLSSFPDYLDETRRQHGRLWQSKGNRRGDAPWNEF